MEEAALNLCACVREPERAGACGRGGDRVRRKRSARVGATNGELTKSIGDASTGPLTASASPSEERLDIENMRSCETY